MSMLELTPDFIKEFAAYLSTEAGLQNSSIWANCMWLKGVVMKAHYQVKLLEIPLQIIERYPLFKAQRNLLLIEYQRIKNNKECNC